MLTLALIWIAEKSLFYDLATLWCNNVLFIWVSFRHRLISYFQSVILVFGSFVGDKVRSSQQIQPAWTVCESLYVCVWVCFHKSQHQFEFLYVLFYTVPLFHTPKHTEPQSWIMDKEVKKFQILKVTIIKMRRMMIPKHWAVFILIEYMNVAKALCSWKQKGKLQFVPLISVYFIVAQYSRYMKSFDLHWDTWFWWTFTKKEKDKVLL